jgi:hypothetical protein
MDNQIEIVPESTLGNETCFSIRGGKNVPYNDVVKFMDIIMEKFYPFLILRCGNDIAPGSNGHVHPRLKPSILLDETTVVVIHLRGRHDIFYGTLSPYGGKFFYPF